MKKRCLSTLQTLLFMLLLFALTGCGASSSNIAGNDGNPSSKITAKFNWAADGKSTAKAVAAVPAGVVSVRLRITGPYQIPGDTSTASRYTAAKATFPAAAGSGSIAVFPGTGLIVIAEALDAGDTVLYEGIVSSLNGAPIAVAAGATTDLGTITIKAPPVKEADKPCLACHENSRAADGNSLVAEYKTSRHYNITTSPAAKFGVTSTGCAGCHGPQHNDLNPSESGRCYDCHTAAGVAPGSHEMVTVQNKCATCHDPHTLEASLPSDGAARCTVCHSIGQNAGATYVQDNNGVRAVIGEFSKWSHHVTGRAVTDADCAVCHLEGKKSGAAVAVDAAFHMKDNKTYLRNCNVGLGQTPDKSVAGAYPWNPAAPDHTLMDQFCFSCHNAQGAPTAISALAGVTGISTVATNPFNDTMSNQYDLLSRPAVVNAFDQFDTGNSSHHAVRGARFTKNALNQPEKDAIALYNSTAINRSTLTATTPATLGFSLAEPNLVVDTMFAAGAFTTAYTPLGATESVRDTSTLHCGDCHTVGQFKPGSSVNADGTATALAIGAHGSENEYMLRKPNGSEDHITTAPQRDALVCYLCHKASVYQNNFANGTPAIYPAESPTRFVGHAGIVSAGPTLLECNTDGNNAQGKVGLARIVSEDIPKGGGYAFDSPLVMNPLLAGKYGGNGGGNIYAQKCANCHNASDKKTFGGIHGNAGNATYTTYSAASSWPANGDVYTAVQRKPYRFLPGLGNFRYNGGATPEQWTQRSLYAGKGERRGCYTLNGASSRAVAGVAGRANIMPTRAVLSGDNVATNAPGFVPGSADIANDNGILGSWGACSDHAGNSYSGVSEPLARTIIRPLTY